MEPFFLFMGAFASDAASSDMRVDITGRLPVELAIIILRNLDPRSLLSAAMVNKRWLSLCRADSVLRQRIRQQIVTERLERLTPFTVTVERDIQQPRPFSALNNNRRITFNPVSNIVRPNPTHFERRVMRRFTTSSQTYVKVERKMESSTVGKIRKTSTKKVLRL